MAPSRKIADRHQRAIDRLTEEYQHDDRFLAIIIGGSVAKGYARPDSDVDFMIVATDREFARLNAEEDLFINRRDLCDYDGGFVDGKVIDLEYLREVASFGNEPTRAAFQGAFFAFCHEQEIADLLPTIPVYPDSGHDQRIKTFYSMAFIQNWLMGEATRHDNPYTRLRAASQLSLFAGRLILAHNRVLYPYHKWLIRALQDAPDKPEGFMASFAALNTTPSAQAADELFSELRGFQDWGVEDIEAFDWFMREVEWEWRSGKASLEDL
ncbi:MAG: nucleotidyltransferase domain-containing protein [Woeseiaceae bacterium]